MRKALVLLLCAVSMASAVLPAASAKPPEWQVTHGISAIAIWTEPIAGSPRYDVYWAFGVQGVEENELRTYGGLGHYTCSTDDWGIVQLFCFRGKVRRLTDGEFTIDPTLGEAHLAIEQKGIESEITWTASDTPALYQDVMEFGPYYSTGAMIRREADIEANIMGERFVAKDSRWFANLSAHADIGVDTTD